MCQSLLYLNIIKGLMIFQWVLYNRRKTEGTDPSLVAREGGITFPEQTFKKDVPCLNHGISLP